MATQQHSKSRHVHALEGVSRVLKALDAPPPEPSLRERPYPWLPEHVTAEEARRDLEDPDPRIRRYAKTVVGLHAEGDRREAMAGRVEYEVMVG